MPELNVSRPVRSTAGAAVFVSILVHILLILALWFVPEQSREKLPSLSANELVVIVGDEERAREARGGRIDVTLSAIERPTKAAVAPAPEVTQPRVVDSVPSAAPVDPSVDPIPHVRAHGDGGGETPGGTDKSFFPVSALGSSVVYVLDRSMSMGVHDGLRQARAELLTSLSRLPPTTLFQVIPYNQIAEPLSVHNYGGMLTADAETLAEVAKALAALRATGRTNHIQALLCGLKFRPDVIFFVTDADELTAKEVDALSLYNGGRCSIHVIDLSPRPDDPANALRRLALQNRGTYRRVGVKEF